MSIDELILSLNRHLKVPLTPLQELILKESYQGVTYQEIADRYDYSADYIREIGAGLWPLLSDAIGEEITKRTCFPILKRYIQRSQPSSLIPVQIPPLQSANRQDDWEEAINVNHFLGRTQELETLQNWILKDQCRLIGIFGIGGIGKTALAVKLAQQVHTSFDVLIWRSLRNAPPLKSLLIGILKLLSQQQETIQSLPPSEGELISILIRYLQQQRCLLVLDNAESILQSGDRCGQYRPGYEVYGELQQQIGRQQHQSCVLLTSREKPLEISQFEGDMLPVRSLQLAGLDVEAGRSVVELKGMFSGTAQNWQRLVELYGGNPLALNITAASIRDVFRRDITAFLKHAVFAFDDIETLLNEQFNRLSKLEQQVMYWLAIEREPITVEELGTRFLDAVSRRELFESVKSLVRRSLIEQTDQGFTQQSVVMEYLVDKLRQQLTQELVSHTPNLLMSHALTRGSASEYIQRSQRQVLLEPIIQRLLAAFEDLSHLEQILQRMLDHLREHYSQHMGYGAGNILYLLQTLGIDLHNYDLSALIIREVDFQAESLMSVNLRGAQLDNVKFAHNLDYYFAVSIDPTGRYLVGGGGDGGISLWNFPDMTFVCLIPGHGHWVNKFTFSPNGQLLAAAGFDGTVRVLRMPLKAGPKLDLGLVTTLEHAGPVSSVDFSPDGKTLVSVGHDSQICFWDAGTWQQIAVLHEASIPIGAVAFSPDGQTLATGSFDGHIRLYDLVSFPAIDQAEKYSSDQHSAPIWSLVFHPEGHTFFTSSHDRTIKTWDRQTGKCLSTLLGHVGKIPSVVITRDGRVLASSSHDNTIRLWATATGKCLKVLQDHQGEVWDVAFSPDNKILASTALDHSIRLWNTTTGQLLNTLQGNRRSIWSIAFSPDGQYLLSGGEDRKLRLWDVNRHRCLTSWVAHTDEVTSVSFHPEGSWVVSSGSDRLTKLWDLQSQTCIQALPPTEARILSVAVSPDGRLLASAGCYLRVPIWDTLTGQCVQILPDEHTADVWSVCFSRDGQYLATGSNDGLVKLWETRSWQCIGTFTGHMSWVNSVCFNSTNSLLASGDYGGAVKIWDINTQTCIHTLTRHTGVIWSLACSPNGHQLASGSFDGTVKIWDMQTGQCLTTLRGHKGYVVSVCYHPQKNFIASSSRDGTIRFWNPTSGECLSILEPPKLYEGLNLAGAVGLNEQQHHMLLDLGAIEKG